MGRPTKLTDELIEKIGQAIQLGTGLYRAGELVGATEENMRRWMRQGERDLTSEETEDSAPARLVLVIREKTAKVAALVEGSVLRAALHERDIRASTWWLERRLPDEYGRKDKIEVHVKQQMVEDLLDHLRDRISAEAYSQVIAALVEDSGGEAPAGLIQ